MHSGIVEVKEEVQQDSAIYSDVEVRTKDKEGTQVWGVYAKIVQINEKEIQLRFTHINKRFGKFVARLNLEKGIGYDQI